MYAKMAADVVPSVAPPKIAADVGCPSGKLIDSCGARVDPRPRRAPRNRPRTRRLLNRNCLRRHFSKRTSSSLSKQLSQRRPPGYPLTEYRASIRTTFKRVSTARHCARLSRDVKQHFFCTIFCGHSSSNRRHNSSAELVQRMRFARETRRARCGPTTYFTKPRIA